MYYLYGYLLIGVVVLLFAILQQRRQKNFVSDFSKTILENLHPERKLWRYRLLHEITLPSLAGLLIIVSWPIAIHIHFKLQRKKELADDEEFPDPPKFSVLKENLVEKTTRSEIEAKEIVYDPMGAAPNVPFGHLNTSWQHYIVNLEPSDAIWTFSAPWEPQWGSTELRMGYAIVRDSTIPHHYVTRYG